MELCVTANEFVIKHFDYFNTFLVCSREDGRLSIKKDFGNHGDCCGQIFGVLGILRPKSVVPPLLLVITKAVKVGLHPIGDCQIWKIERVLAIPVLSSKTPESIHLTDDQDNFVSSSSGLVLTLEQLRDELEPCSKHAKIERKFESSAPLNFGQRQLQKSMNKVVEEAHRVKGSGKEKISLPQSKYEVWEGSSSQWEESASKWTVVIEMLQLFNEHGCFYFSNDLDLTSSVQRLSSHVDKDEPCWRRADDRFFWNRHLLRDLLDGPVEYDHRDLSRWIVPVIQGYVGFRTLPLRVPEDYTGVPFKSATASDDGQRRVNITLTVISRRSVHRAGTRYLRRGVDELGHVANYVETEQVLPLANHLLTFVQVRGSIPVFWSQPGYKYKPPPRIERDSEDNFLAFQKHFSSELAKYGKQVVVNLVECAGKEQVLAAAFLEQFLRLDSPNLAYYAFDFHDYCRAMHFENVTILTTALEETLRAMRFCWVDKGKELACTQEGVFRVNCVDCLDRTNVVQSAIAKCVLISQLQKFGLLAPEELLPRECDLEFKLLWASNGDSISKQYAGTGALKADYYKTGQRNLAGLFRDGYNSASRYYLCHMKDASRQEAIDFLLGVKPSSHVPPQLQSPNSETELWLKEKDEQLRLLVQDCQRMFLPEDEIQLGGWALINADSPSGLEEPLSEDMDTVVMLTKRACYVADYDEDLDKFVDFSLVPLEDVEKIEVGTRVVGSNHGLNGLRNKLKKASGSRNQVVCIRVHFSVSGQSGFFHTWRAASTRLFNNMAIAIKSPEEANEYVNSIAEQFTIAMTFVGLKGVLVHVDRIEAKKSKIQPANQSRESPIPLPFLTSILGGASSPRQVRSILGAKLATGLRTLGKAANKPLSSTIQSGKKPRSERPTPTPLPSFVLYSPTPDDTAGSDESLEDWERDNNGHGEISSNVSSDLEPDAVVLSDLNLKDETQWGLKASCSESALKLYSQGQGTGRNEEKSEECCGAKMSSVCSASSSNLEDPKAESFIAKGVPRFFTSSSISRLTSQMQKNLNAAFANQPWRPSQKKALRDNFSAEFQDRIAACKSTVVIL